MSKSCSFERRISRTAALFCFVALIGMLAANAQRAANAERPPLHVAIGNSVVVLTGPWAFHPGDDMAWAQPGYDDSSWAAMDLTPPPGSLDPIVGSSGYVPGWTAQGFPRLTGYAWYRLRVDVSNLAPGAPSPLAIKLPDNFDDAYQVFINGELIGDFGRFTPGHVTSYLSQPRAFPLPAHLRSGPVVIAIRMFMETSTLFESQDAGGLHAPPMLGAAASIDAMLRLDWDDQERGDTPYVLVIPLSLVAILLGVILFRLDRREPAYVWLAFASAGHLLLALNVVVPNFIDVSGDFAIGFSDAVITPVTFGCWIVFWQQWFGLRSERRVLRIGWALVLLEGIGIAMLRAPLYGGVVPVSVSAWLVPVTVALKLALGALIFWVVFQGMRRNRTEGLLAVLPVLLLILRLYQEELMSLHVPVILNVFGIPVTIGAIGLILMLAVISLLMLRRFMRSLRQKQQLETEMEQARQVQQVLIPEQLPTVPGFAIESEYIPAQQVGGDFFQILPAEGGGLLAVIGDVSGKGMPAAMTVSMLVGTMRTLAETTSSPTQILSGLNRRIMGRAQGGFTTCLVVRVDADGKVTAANAGHLSPYADGKEIAIESGLPLGLNAEPSYPETTFHLNKGEQLTFMTDGVVEARSQSGDLLGFDRAAELVRQNRTAGEIAAEARHFGQQDDITVVRIQREAPTATAVAGAVVPLAAEGMA